MHHGSDSTQERQHDSGDPPRQHSQACPEPVEGTYPIGYFDIDIAEVQTAEGKLRLFVAIDRTSKFAFVELHQQAGKMIAAQYLHNLIEAVPYAIHR